MENISKHLKIQPDFRHSGLFSTLKNAFARFLEYIIAEWTPAFQKEWSGDKVEHALRTHSGYRGVTFRRFTPKTHDAQDFRVNL